MAESARSRPFLTALKFRIAVFQAIGSIASEAPASQDLALFNRCEWRCRVPRATPRIRLIQITISEAVSTEERATQLATECRRSDNRLVGKECVSTCRSRGAPV